MITVALWTLGLVGRAAIPVIHAHPRMRLVGAYTRSPEKDGVDIGVLSGLDPIGIAASRDVDALIALRPDCVLYVPQFPDVNHMVRLLEAGINIVSTAYFMNGRAFGTEGHARIAAAAMRGRSSIYGTGINPGFANILGLVATQGCRRVDRVTVLESVDCTNYASVGTWEAMGIGRPIGDATVAAFMKQSTPSFHEAVEMMADALNVRLDGEVRFDVEFAAATETMDLGFMTIREGHISALRGTWSGWVGGRPFVELKVAWKLGYKHAPDWPIEHGYLVEIEGDPNVRCRYEPVGATMFDPALVTAMPAVHAIPAVCAAAPGIVTAADLPLIVARDCGPQA